MPKNDLPVTKLTFSEISERPDYTYRCTISDTDYHQHYDFYEIILVTQGSFKHIYNHRTEIIEKGSLLLFDINQKHELLCPGSDNIHFTLVLSQYYFELLSHMFVFQQNVFEEKKYIRFQLDDVAFEYLYALANNILNKPSATSDVKLFFYIAMTHLLSEGSDMSTNNVDIVDDICEKIRNYSYLNANMMDVYKNYPYTPSTIIKMFKKRTGTTPVRYQTEVRLQYAARLLRETLQPIEHIISSLGFHSTSHFYELFKAYYQQTPNAYREERNRVLLSRKQ